MWAAVLLVGASAAVRRGDGPHSATVGESGYSSMSDSLPPLSPLSKHEPFAFTRRDAPGTTQAAPVEPKHSPINPVATIQAFRAQVKTGLTDGQVLGFLRLGGATAYRELLARIKSAVEAQVPLRRGPVDPEAVLAPYDDFDPQDFETLEAFAEHLVAGAPARARQHRQDEQEGRLARSNAAKVALVAVLDTLMPVEVATLPASVQAIVASRLQMLLSGYGWDAGGSGPASDPSLVKAATKMARDLQGYTSAGGCHDAKSYELAVRMLKNANWDLRRANQQFQNLHAGWEYSTGPRRMAREAGARWRARQRGSQ